MATAWMHVGDDGDAVLGVMAATPKRPIDDLREQLPIGSPSHVAEVVTRYRDTELQRMFVLWPIGENPVEQLQRFADAVL